MYESPISLMIAEKTREIVGKADNAIFRAVRDVLPMVDQKELIRALQYDRGQYDKGYADGYANGKADAAEWIPVTERLPETDTDVLAYCYWHESLQTQVCHLSSNNEGCWYISITGQWTPMVTHWMPLPEAPKGE